MLCHGVTFDLCCSDLHLENVVLHLGNCKFYYATIAYHVGLNAVLGLPHPGPTSYKKRLFLLATGYTGSCRHVITSDQSPYFLIGHD